MQSMTHYLKIKYLFYLYLLNVGCSCVMVCLLKYQDYTWLQLNY